MLSIQKNQLVWASTTTTEVIGAIDGLRRHFVPSLYLFPIHVRMYKMFSVLVSLICLVSLGHAQHSSANAAATVSSVELAQAVYHQALSLADYQTAQYALHQLVIADQDTQQHWRDTLLFVYAESGAWRSAHLLAAKLREQRPNDNVLLAIDATALSQLGAAREAISAYELLYGRTRKAIHGYELATLQQGIKRLAEAEAVLAQVLASDIKENEDAMVSAPTTTGAQQSVPLKAATLNLRGLVAYDMKQNNIALDYFRQALEIMPDFVIAKQNEQAIMAAMAALAPKK